METPAPVFKKFYTLTNWILDRLERYPRSVRIRPAGRPQIGINEQRRIAQLYRTGHTIAELRDIFHRTTTTIQRVMKRQGVVSRPKGQKRKYIPPLPKQGRRHV